MSIVFTLVPLILFIISSYYFNNYKMNETTSYINKISLLEAFLSYLIVVVLFLQGFISVFLLLLIVFVLIAAISLIIISIDGEYGTSDILELETIKNNLVLFGKTILPFYVFLTVFRYLPPYFQIPLAIAISVTIFCLSKKVYSLLLPVYKKIGLHFSMLGPKEYFFLWSSVILILISTLTFDFPKNVVGEYLNLSNNVSYLSVDGFPTTIANNYHQKEILQIDSTELIDSKITDYYYDDTHLYIYTDQNRLVSYNLSTKEIVFNEVIEDGTVLDGGLYGERLHNTFIYYDGYLILLGNKETFLVTPDSATNISNISSYNSMSYYLDNELYIINRFTASVFNIYKFDDGVLSLTESIDANTAGYDNILVISETLFIDINNNYYLYDDLSISFSEEPGTPIYDISKQILYFSTSNYYNTEHHKVYFDDETETISLQREHNYIGLIIDEKIYLTADIESKKNRVEIINDDFEIVAIYNHQELEPFWFQNFFTNSYIGNYQENNETLEFIQIDENYRQTMITIYQLEEKDVYINLPLYTHYGIGIFISLTIIFLTPISHHQGTFTVIGFEEMSKKKKTEKE